MINITLPKKYLILYSILGILLLSFLATSIFVITRKSDAPYSVTPTPVQENTELTPIKQKVEPLIITSTYPQDQAKNIPANKVITIIFNRKFKPEEISFVINPDISKTIKINENILEITPKEPFQTGVYYTFSINYVSSATLPRTYSFTTIGPTHAILPDTYPTGALEEENEFLRQKHPDVFLANKTPYETDDFSISSEYKTVPFGHFSFLVQLKNPDKNAAKTLVLAWLKSLRFTDSQIQTLDLEYRPLP